MSTKPWEQPDVSPCRISAEVLIFSIVQIPAQMFLTLWKRRQSILQWEWDLGAETEDNDEMRPEWDDLTVTFYRFSILGLGDHPQSPAKDFV